MLSDGASAASSARGVNTATAHATPHTVGSWTEVVAALSEDVGWVNIAPGGNVASSGVNTSALLNLGVGAAASEVAVLPSLGVGYWGSISTVQHPGWLFPLFIPKGSRVAIQCQGAVTAQAVPMRFAFFAPSQLARPSNKILAFGANLATSAGVVLATPGGNNTEGAWTEITAATPEPLAALAISVQGGGSTTHASASALVDIAIGAAGSEVPVVTDIGLQLFSTEAVNYASPLIHPVDIPAGTRLAARWQGSAVTGAVDVILHGIRKSA